MSVPKLKSKKDSLVSFIRKYSHDIDACIDFFFHIKFPGGFSCDHCDSHDYHIFSRNNTACGYVIVCKNCGHQYHLMAGTVFQDSKLPLFKILLGLFIFFVHNKGVTAIEMRSHLDVNYKTACLFNNKCRMLMSMDEGQKLLDSAFYEADILEIGGKDEGKGKRGRGSNKQNVLLILSTQKENEYPQYIKLKMMKGYQGEPVKRYMEKVCVLTKERVLNTDKDNLFNEVSKLITTKQEIIDYKDKGHKLNYLNIIAGNIQNNVIGIYHGVVKKYLQLYLNEQAWRYNHRRSGRTIMEKVSKYIQQSMPITHKMISKAMENAALDIT